MWVLLTTSDILDTYTSSWRRDRLSCIIADYSPAPKSWRRSGLLAINEAQPDIRTLKFASPMQGTPADHITALATLGYL